MLDADARDRYLRHILLKEVGAQGQQKLLAARVLTVGAGGLGSPIIQYLAAAGVGTIGVADDDRVALSNLQRQTIYRDEDVGALKAERAAAFARALNPEIRIVAHRERLDAANAAARIGGYDLVVEGVDSFAGRFAINAACIEKRKPLVSAAIGRFEGQLAVFKPWAGAGLGCYRCLVPEAPPRDAVYNDVWVSMGEEHLAAERAKLLGGYRVTRKLMALTDRADTIYLHCLPALHDDATEFGRTAKETGNRGTDHGHASALFVLGGQVKGGQVYGKWPGLRPEERFEGRDLAVTTDFRTLFSEVLSRHLGAADLAAINERLDDLTRQRYFIFALELLP